MRYTLDEICISLVRGPFGSALKKEYFVELGENTYKVYEQGNAIRKSVGYGQYYITAEKYAELQRFAVKPLDFIMSCSGTIGELYQIPKDAHIGIINQALLKITLNNEIVDYDFFRYIFKNNISRLEAKGSGIQNVASVKVLKEMKFEIPDITEQRRIVIILNKLSDIINKRKRELSVLDDLMKARFVEMFGTPYGNEKGFPMKTVDDVIEFTGGSQPDKKYFEYEPSEDNIRLIQIRDYKTDNYTTYIPKSMAKRFCDADDIMIGRYGPPIFQILKGIEGSYNVALMKATPKMGNKEFVRHFLMQDCLFNYLDGLSQRTAGQSGIEMPALKKYPFPYPPIDLQNEFEQFAEHVDKSKVAVQKSLDETKLLFDSLMQEYFG